MTLPYRWNSGEFSKWCLPGGALNQSNTDWEYQPITEWLQMIILKSRLRDHGYIQAMRSSSIKKKLSKRLKVDPILQISRILRKKQHAKKIFADTELRLSTANEIKIKMTELKADLEDIENFKQSNKVLKKLERHDHLNRPSWPFILFQAL